MMKEELFGSAGIARKSFRPTNASSRCIRDF